MNSLLDALQELVAAQHRAVFGYQLLGARLPMDEQARARAGEQAHEAGRDAVSQLVTAAGVGVTPALSNYADLKALARSPRSIGADVEDACALAWRAVFAACSQTMTTTGADPLHGLDRPGLRRAAQSGLTAAALAALRWRGSRAAAPAFPGT